MHTGSKKLILLFSCVVMLLLSFRMQQRNQQTEPDLQESIQKGEKIYAGSCLSCHLENGEGLSGIYPPLANSEYLMEDKARSIQQIRDGVSGEIVVDGVFYNAEMPASGLSDEEVANVLNYIRNSWGNKGEAVTFQEVRKSESEG